MSDVVERLDRFLQRLASSRASDLGYISHSEFETVREAKDELEHFKREQEASVQEYLAELAEDEP